MATFEEQSDAVLNIVSDRKTLAEQQLAITNGLIDDARLALTAAIASYQSVGWTVSVAGVDTTFVPSTEAAPTVPSEDTVAIGDTDWNAAYLRAEGLQDRIGRRRIWEASNLAAANGHAQLSETQAALLLVAQDEDDQRSSDNALTSAFEQAKAAREDVISLVNLRLNKWGTAWRVTNEAEGVRVQYERLELDKNLEPERGRASSELQSLDLSLRNANAQLIDLVQTYAQITNGLFSTSDVGLSSQVGINLTGDA